MLTSSPDRMLRAPAHRMLIARAIIAVGLALLLVVSAWSTSHGAADVHATLCLAPGVSHPAAASAHIGDDGATAIQELVHDAAVCVVVVLCAVVLVMLFRRLLGHGHRAVGGRDLRLSPPLRAGPRLMPVSLSLTQLSISRT